MIETGSPWIRLAEADLRVEARMIRQRRLTGDEPLRLTAVLSEAALRQQIGGPAVLVAQLRHLVTMVEEHPDTVKLSVVPFSSPGYPALARLVLPCTGSCRRHGHTLATASDDSTARLWDTNVDQVASRICAIRWPAITNSE